MGCDFYIYNYLYVYFGTSYIPIFINYKKGYFSDYGDYDDDEDEDEADLIPKKPILIYSVNNFVNWNYEEEYTKLVQDKLETIGKKWENITTIKKIEKRIERF